MKTAHAVWIDEFKQQIKEQGRLKNSVSDGLTFAFQVQRSNAIGKGC
ncbi:MULTISPECIES: hypothetical protein [Neisseria]|uniref:Uncharacterized protein n=1 Tax=Neisseria brasiliensis TaxID=2666100 RepID=A0A7X2GZB6_9NEIS|nr:MULTISPECIES: hypothetical protein [Neisseria]MRN38751.1 hypothetical protein [Neisseria brasiliensis]